MIMTPCHYLNYRGALDRIESELSSKYGLLSLSHKYTNVHKAKEEKWIISNGNVISPSPVKVTISKWVQCVLYHFYWDM